MSADFRALCAELLQPVVGSVPSDEELDEIFHEHCSVFDDLMDHEAFPAAARAVLARYGATPTPIPVAERLPCVGDCDAQGRCWFYSYDEVWMLEDRTYGSNAGRSHWIPANALPLPVAPGATP